MSYAAVVLMDVVMGIIGIFLMLAFFVGEDAGKNSTPEAVSSSRAAPEALMESAVSETPDTTPETSQDSEYPALTIEGAGNVVRALYLDNTQVQMDELAKQIALRSIKTLRVRAAPGLTVQTEREIKLRCKQAGVDNFQDVYFKKSGREAD